MEQGNRERKKKRDPDKEENSFSIAHGTAGRHGRKTQEVLMKRRSPKTLKKSSVPVLTCFPSSL